MPTITIPKSFFVKERRMYSCWQFAFWREFFQNSIDANATRIDIYTTDLGDGLSRIRFVDNGVGMSRETLENVYFRLGATSKEGEDMVGGFGRARILTCFSMRDYQIHTRDNLVQGDGGDYTILETEYLQGTDITVHIENENYSYLWSYLHEYLRFSKMNCDVFVNNIRYTDWMEIGTHIRNLELKDVAFASVHSQIKGSARWCLSVRVRGVLMFKQYINSDMHVMIEIEPGKSREILTANRDGLQGEYAKVLEQLTQELASETRSALIPKFKKKDMTIRGHGLFYSVGKSEQVQRTSALKKSNEVKQEVRVQEIFGLPEDSEPQVVVRDPETKPSMELLTSNLPDIFIVDDTTNDKVKKIIDNYVPLNWVTIDRNGRRVNKGSVMYKLLMYWKIACEHAVDSFLRANPNWSGISWGIGWVFSDTSEAKYLSVENGCAFLLNPVDAEGNLKFFLTSQESQKRLMAYAKHEVAHIVSTYHNEDFARALTYIDVAYDERLVFRRMREFVA
jgi:hypothetical protein